MDMNEILKLAAQIVEKLSKDEKLMDAFKKDPVAVVEKKLGIDLPNDQIEKVVDMIKAKINVEKISGALGGIGKLFGK